MHGRIVLLTAASAPLVDEHLQREADEARWTSERAEWLARAVRVKAPAGELARLSGAGVSASVVGRSRALYLDSAERVVRAARRTTDWGVVARIRRDQAAALYAEAGHPVPPPEDVVQLHREGMLAELHSIGATTKFAELVGARCCPACRADDGTAVRISTELRNPRLPHEGCPKGICGCEWWIATAAPRKPRRRRSTPSSSEARAQPPTPGHDATGQRG